MRRSVGLALLCVMVCAAIPLHAKTAVQASPRAVEHNNRGVLLIEQGAMAQAEFELKTAIQLSPDYAEAYNNLGILYKKQRRHELAIANFEKAAKLDKHYAAPLSHLGAVYIDQGNYERAIAVLRKAIAKERTFAEAVFNLGLAFLMRARETPEEKKKQQFYAESEKQFIVATQLNPRFSEAHANLGDLYLETGQLENAEIRYRLALEDNPHQPHVYTQLADVLRRRGKSADAATITKQGGDITREASAKSAFDAGYALMETGENLAAEKKTAAANDAFRKARQSFQQALRHKPDFPQAAYGLGLAQQRLGDRKGARAAWQQTLALAPTHPGALYNLGTLALQEGFASEGLVHYCKFLDVAGNTYPDQVQVVREYLKAKAHACPK